MKKWKIYSIIITVILLLIIIGICVYALILKENITEEEAKNIAFERANVAESDVNMLAVNKDNDDRKYEVSFYDDNYEYEVDINYNNGKVESFEKDIRDDGITNNNTSNDDTANTNNASVSDTNNNSNVANAIGNSSNTTNTTNNGSEYIGEDGAREIALAYAGITNSNDVRFSKIELDVDRNVSIYEIEFYYNNIEYDYEINAQTGEVIKYKKGY